MMWILWTVGGLVGLVAVVALVGMMLPQNHTVSRTLRLKQPPEAVWKTITDCGAMPQWRSELKKIERMPDANGHEVWKEYNSAGEMPLETIEAVAPRRLVRKIGAGLPFGGKWTYELTPAGTGTLLKITEDGEVYNVIFRVVGKFMDPAASMTTFLTGLAKKFGEEPAFL
jgi:uncharacterized protein YndB with AHSA1/START domain